MILSDFFAGQFSIVGLALVKPQLGCVEHYPLRIQNPANKKGARPQVISFKTYNYCKPQEMTYQYARNRPAS